MSKKRDNLRRRTKKSDERTSPSRPVTRAKSARPAPTARPAQRTASRRRARSERPGVAQDLTQSILEALEHEGAPLMPDELAERLRIPQHARAGLDGALDALLQAGALLRNRAGSVLVARRIALVAGRIDGHPDGYGFLAPDEPGPSIYLSHAEMRQALHGDRATVRVAGRDARGRPSGTIVEVFPRPKRSIVGRLHTEHGVLFLVPEDRRIAQDVLVPPVQGGVRARVGQVVTVELIAQPSVHAQPIGRVVEVIGEDTDPGHRDRDCGAQVRSAARIFEEDRSRRRARCPRRCATRTSKVGAICASSPFVTIDGETAKDFDDAVFCERDGRATDYWVAIADVSHYVRDGAPLDVDARERAHFGLLSAPCHPDAARAPVERPVLAQSRGRPPRHGVRDGDHPARRDCTLQRSFRR